MELLNLFSCWIFVHAEMKTFEPKKNKMHIFWLETPIFFIFLQILF